MNHKQEKGASLFLLIGIALFLLYWWKKQNPNGLNTVFGYLPPSLGGPVAPGGLNGGACKSNSPDLKQYRQNLASKNYDVVSAQNRTFVTLSQG